MKKSQSIFNLMIFMFFLFHSLLSESQQTKKCPSVNQTKEGCFCESTDMYYDPQKISCPNQWDHVVQELQEKLTHGASPACDLKSKPTKKEIVKNSPEKIKNQTHNQQKNKGPCDKPIEEFCDEGTNQSVALINEASQILNQYDQESNQYDDVKKILKNNQIQDCYGLYVNKDNSKYEECAKTKYQHMKPKVFTEANKMAVQQIFKESQNQINDFLTELQKHPPRDLSDTSIYENFKKGIKNSSLHFEGDEELYPYKRSQTSRNVQNKIVINEIAFLADSCPDCIRRTILHELGHSIDNRHLNSLKSSPFDDVIQCLHDKDHGGANFGDAGCFHKWALENKSNSEKAKKAEEIAQQIEKRSDYPFGSDFKVNGQRVCQVAQTSEVLADWIASEAMALDIQKKVDQKTPDQVLKKQVLSFAAYLCSKKKDSETTSTKTAQNDSSNFSEHPRTTDRIEKIIFGQPTVRKILKCEPENSPYYCKPQGK